MSFMTDLAALMPDTITVTPGTVNEYGAFVASGSTSTPNCRIEGETIITKDATGREIVSTVQAYLDGVYDLTTHLHRYTLPSRYSPNSQIQAVGIERWSDETGPIYEVVLLP